MGKHNYVNVIYPILRRKDLSMREKVLYSWIVGFWTERCTASNEYIAKTFGCDKRSIQRSIAILKEKNLIICRNIIKDGKIVGRMMRSRREVNN